jgi:hypothetical protein
MGVMTKVTFPVVSSKTGVLARIPHYNNDEPVISAPNHFGVTVEKLRISTYFFRSYSGIFFHFGVTVEFSQNSDGDQENAPLPFNAIDICSAAYSSAGTTSSFTKSTLHW